MKRLESYSSKGNQRENKNSHRKKMQANKSENVYSVLMFQKLKKTAIFLPAPDRRSPAITNASPHTATNFGDSIKYTAPRNFSKRFLIMSRTTPR